MRDFEKGKVSCIDNDSKALSAWPLLDNCFGILYTHLIDPKGQNVSISAHVSFPVLTIRICKMFQPASV